MERFKDIDPDKMTEAQRQLYARIAAPPRGRVAGPFRVLLSQPELAEPIEKLGRHLRFDSLLLPALRELAILATARHLGCAYEWIAHEPHARSAGLGEEVIAAIRRHERPDNAGADVLVVYDVCRELQRLGTVSDATFAVALNELGHAGIVELVALVGYYTLLAMTLNAFGVPLPEGSQPPFHE